MKTSIRWNEEQKERHEAIKEYLGLGTDAETVHVAEEVCYNVLHQFFGKELAKVFKRKIRYVKAEQKLGRPKKPKIVPHPLSDL